MEQISDIETATYGPRRSRGPAIIEIITMDKAEVQKISKFLNDVYEGICEGDGAVAMQQQLTEIYRVIKRLMDAISKAPERERPFFAMLEYNARQYKQALEAKLGARN